MVVLTNNGYGFLIHDLSWLAESFPENITESDSVSAIRNVFQGKD